MFVAWPVPACAFDLQGHRGTRGLAPENTLAAFRRALEIGVPTLETDLAITRDRKIVLSHEAVLNPDIVRDSKGTWVIAPTPTILSLDLETIRSFDVGRLRPGTKYAAQWPLQHPADGERMPTLDELFALAKSWPKPVRLNIETKLSPTKPDETVKPDEFARVVVDAVRAAGMFDRVTMQSFDWRTLLEARRLTPDITTVCLTIDTERTSNVRTGDGSQSPWLGGVDTAARAGSVPNLVKAAGCAAWSPFWRNVTPDLVAQSHDLGLKVVPWTVNEPAEMARLIDMKVDGLITDYPDRARTVMAAKGLELP
jgi:glycerophosphoryl diester phosphodiesterase